MAILSHGTKIAKLSPPTQPSQKKPQLSATTILGERMESLAVEDSSTHLSQDTTVSHRQINNNHTVAVRIATKAQKSLLEQFS